MAAACRSCDAPILWAKTPGDRPIPLDATPVPDGNVELIHERLGQAPLAIVHGQAPFLAGDLYLPHFATCPNADEWRTR